MKTTALFACHCLLAAWYAFIMYRISAIMNSKRHEVDEDAFYGGQWRFLTVLNLLFQVIFFGISSLTDAIVLMKKHQIAKLMFSFRDLLYAGLAFPISTFVFIMFWTIYSYDRKLVYPEKFDASISTWLNHAMHTGILPLILLDLLITPRRYPSKGKGLSLLAIGSVAYIIWLLWIHSATGKWVYPILRVLGLFSKLAFFAGIAVFLLFIYNTGEFLCRMIWGDSVVVLDTYKKKSN